MGDNTDNNEVVDGLRDELVLDERTYDEQDKLLAPSIMSGKKILSLSGLYLSLMTFAIFAGQLLVTIIVSLVVPDAAEAGWYNVVLTAIGIGGVGLPVFYLLMKRIPDTKIGEIEKLSFGKFIGFFLVCAAAAYISNMVGLFIGGIIEIIKGIEVGNPIETLFSGSMVLPMIYAIVGAPILEEIIFRKILLDKLRRFGDLPAMLITGFAFGIFHFNLAQFFYATVLGILFAYITLRTNRLRYSILLHMMINSIGAGITPLIVASENMYAMAMISFGLLIVMTVGSVLFIINIKKIKLFKPNKPLVRTWEYILNPGGLLFLILGGAMIILSLFGL